jgi:hypothetical protein
MSITALLVRWSGGHIEVEDPNAYSPGVREEGFLRAGDSQYAADARELAEAILVHMADREERITAAVEGAFTAVVGDTLTAPDSTGSSQTWRVVGISYSTDEEGNVIRTPRLELVT